MGRRKAPAKKVVKRVKREVPTIFKCLFCNHDKSVNCKLDMRSMTGSLHCSVCDAKFQTNINSLSEKIDVFTEWLDEASEIQAQAQRTKPSDFEPQKSVQAYEEYDDEENHED
jgi:transcription elongation factor Elf1